MTDAETPDTPGEVVEWLSERSGQTYVDADTAWSVILSIGKSVTEEYVREYDEYADEDGELTAANATEALSSHLKQKQQPAGEARGYLTVYPHKMVLTVADVSAIIMEAIGEEPSSHTAAGAGFTADGRLRENLETLREELADD